METRARYALIGFFILLVAAGGFAFVYWLENSGGLVQRTSYRVRFQSPVPGLLVGSAVLFNGIRVGEVTDLGLSSSDPGSVVAMIGVERGIPVRADTSVSVDVQGLTGGAVISLTGGSADAPPLAAKDGEPPTLVAPPSAGQDWTQAARDAFQQFSSLVADNSDALHSAIGEIDTFAGALARNSDKVDGILAGLEKMTGGSSGKAAIPIYDLTAAKNFQAPATAPSWQLVVPEPTSLMAFNTDKIQLQPAEGQSVGIADGQWSDNVPVLVQEKLLQSFENAGYARAVSRPRDGVANAYQLLLDIRSFRMVASPAPAADVKFMAKIATPDGKVVEAKEFAATAPAKTADAPDAATALNEAFGKAAAELVPWAANILNTQPPPQPANDNESPPSPPAPDDGDASPSSPDKVPASPPPT